MTFVCIHPASLDSPYHMTISHTHILSWIDFEPRESQLRQQLVQLPCKVTVQLFPTSLLMVKQLPVPGGRVQVLSRTRSLIPHMLSFFYLK